MDRERLTTIVGEPGVGKSRLARSLMDAERRLVVIDTMMEHDNVRFVDLYELRELIQDDGPFRVRVVPDDPEQMEWVCKMAAWRPHLCLVVEEYNFHWPAAQSRPPKGMLDIVRVGRKLDQSCVIVCQSPTSIDKTFVEYGTVISFRLRGLRARKYIRDLTDGACDPGHLEYVPYSHSDVWYVNMGVPTHCRMDLRTCALTEIGQEATLSSESEGAEAPQIPQEGESHEHEDGRTDGGGRAGDHGTGQGTEEGRTVTGRDCLNRAGAVDDSGRPEEGEPDA